jgi:hypothetical protein
MPQTVVYKFGMTEKVKILAIGLTGRVDSLMTDKQGPMYRVVYWNDGSRQATWMYDWELQGVSDGRDA